MFVLLNATFVKCSTPTDAAQTGTHNLAIGEHEKSEPNMITGCTPGSFFCRHLLPPPLKERIVSIWPKPVKGAMVYSSGNGVTICGILCTPVGIADSARQNPSRQGVNVQNSVSRHEDDAMGGLLDAHCFLQLLNTLQHEFSISS